MGRYKLKKIKITNLERNILIVLDCLLLIILVFLINFKDNTNDLNDSNNKTYININELFNFNGTLQNKNIFDNKYACLVYLNNDKYESHLVDLNNNKEVEYTDFILNDKYDSFISKIHELLLLKYPTFVVNILIF